MPEKPNIIYLTTHDSGRHFGCYGWESVSTPNIDSIAAEGCRFDGMFGTCPVCSPARAAMMTGRYPQRNGMLGLAHDGWELNEGEKHLSHLLHAQGYQTALIGHYHETRDPDRHLGFEHQSHYKTPNSTHFAGFTTAAEVAEGVEEYLSSTREKNRPLYLQIGFLETHTPFDFGEATPYAENGVDVPEPVVDNAAAREWFAALQGALKSLDNAVGRILQSLDQHGLRENTILVFTTDHGVDISPYLRFKHSLYDRGIEIAWMIRAPGIVQPGTVCADMLSHIGVVPSLLEMADLPIPENLDGQSFAGFSRGEAVGRDAVFAEYSPGGATRYMRAVRTPEWKLIRTFERCDQTPVPVDMSGPVSKGKVPMLQLFNLKDDPYETRNLADDPAHAGRVEELDTRLGQWMTEVDDPLIHGAVATPFYQKSRATLRGVPAAS